MSSEIKIAEPDCVIISSRIFNVEIELLFKAWADPSHLKNWWGPTGFTNTFNEFDFRVGGKWSLIMHGPDKGNYVNECEFIKIEVPTLIAWKRYTKPLFIVIAEFEEINHLQTKLIFAMIFDTPEDCRKVKKYAVDKNEENFDRLEVELTKMVS